VTRPKLRRVRRERLFMTGRHHPSRAALLLPARGSRPSPRRRRSPGRTAELAYFAILTFRTQGTPRSWTLSTRRAPTSSGRDLRSPELAPRGSRPHRHECDGMPGALSVLITAVAPARCTTATTVTVWPGSSIP
jgi:hypothetical protein